MYTETLREESVPTALELVNCADFFHLPQLRTLAERVVKKGVIDESTVIPLAQHALGAGNQQLLRRCVEWFAENPQALTQAAQDSPDEFFELIKSSEIDAIVSKLPPDAGKITKRNLSMLKLNFAREKAI